MMLKMSILRVDLKETVLNETHARKAKNRFSVRVTRQLDRTKHQMQERTAEQSSAERRRTNRRTAQNKVTLAQLPLASGVVRNRRIEQGGKGTEPAFCDKFARPTPNKFAMVHRICAEGIKVESPPRKKTNPSSPHHRSCRHAPRPHRCCQHAPWRWSAFSFFFATLFIWGGISSAQRNRTCLQLRTIKTLSMFMTMPTVATMVTVTTVATST